MKRACGSLVLMVLAAVLIAPSSAMALPNPVVAPAYVNSGAGGLRIVTIYQRVYWSANTPTTIKVTKIEHQTYPSKYAVNGSVHRDEVWLFSNNVRAYYNVCSNSHSCQFPNNIYHSWVPNKITTIGKTWAYGVIDGYWAGGGTADWKKKPESIF
jgi:hypothetical protein